MNKMTIVPAIALCAAAFANAQTIYRCGNSYGETRCPEATVVESARAPSPAEVASAREEVKREAKMAEELAAERRAEEARWRRDDFGGNWDDTADGTARPHLARASAKPAKKPVKKPAAAAPAKRAKKSASA